MTPVTMLVSSFTKISHDFKICDEELYLGLREQKRLNTTVLDASAGRIYSYGDFAIRRGYCQGVSHSGELLKETLIRQLTGPSDQC
jgi:hypothetical protein